MITIANADARHIPLPDQSVQCVVTSPPYWGLRDYGIPDQIGLESTPAEYVAHIVAVMRECKRVLHDDGTLWLNLGDSYNTSPAGNTMWGNGVGSNKHYQNEKIHQTQRKDYNGLKPKDLCGIPWRVAFALQDDGWYLRSDIIWCLSGGTYVYARTQKGDMPMAIKDMARLDPSTVKLWNGEKWTQVLGLSKSHRRGDELEIVLRSGERISCTPTHKFPAETFRGDDRECGLYEAKDLKPGDILQSVCLPQPFDCKDSEYIGADAAWLAGLYIAEGSRSGDTIQIAGHAKETFRWNQVKKIAAAYGGSATRTIDGNNMEIRIYGKVINAIIDQFVSGRTAKDKCLSPVCWQYSNEFLHSLLEGYLSGDGHYDDVNHRWRLGFTRNYNLERDLRTLAARLGFKLTLNLSSVKYEGKNRPTFRGEIRFMRNGYHTERSPLEIVEIRKARCREVYDIGVEDEPHVFSLASGILTHNSKPNPMPESVTDRPTKAHEYVFLLTKRERYYYDAEAIKETGSIESAKRLERGVSDNHKNINGAPGQTPHSMNQPRPNTRNGNDEYEIGTRNRRSVWTVSEDEYQQFLAWKAEHDEDKKDVWLTSTQPYSGAHFAVWPMKLVEPMILASTSARGECPHCGKAWARVVDREYENYRPNSRIPGRQFPSESGAGHTNGQGNSTLTNHIKSTTIDWCQQCACPPHEPIPQTVLDPFAGSGTTGAVAVKHGRKAVLLDLNTKYIDLQFERTNGIQMVMVA